MAHRAIQPADMPIVPFHIGANFALAAAQKDIQLTRSLERLAMNALNKSNSIEETMLGWLKKWGH